MKKEQTNGSRLEPLVQIFENIFLTYFPHAIDSIISAYFFLFNAEFITYKSCHKRHTILSL